MSDKDINKIGNELLGEIEVLLYKLDYDKVNIDSKMQKYKNESIGGLRYEIKLLITEISAQDKHKKADNQLQDLSAIRIDPNIITIRDSCKRARKDLGDITELAISIEDHGQITPILITRDNELIAGERRLQACIEAKVLIDVVYRDQVDDLTMREIELEENIRRKDMTWQESANLVKQITDLKQDKYGAKAAGRSQVGWSLADTASAMGKSRSSVTQDIQLAEAMEVIPELANAKTADDARKMLNKIEEDLIIKELLKRKENQPKAYEFADKNYMLGDAIIGLTHIANNSCDYADVDTPYGIDLGNVKKSQTGTKELKTIGNYQEWDKEIYLDTCRAVAEEVYQILKNNSFCTWWFGMDYYAPLKAMLESVGFQIDPLPAMWYAGAKAAQTNQPQIYFAKSYDTFFMLRKGKPALAKPGRHNVFEYPKLNANDKIHPTEKPIDMYDELIRAIVMPGSKGIVPFLGSGNALRALYNNHCEGFGWDIPEQEAVKNKFLLRVDEDIKNKKYGGM